MPCHSLAAPACRSVGRRIDSRHTWSFETTMYGYSILAGWVGMILGTLLGMV
jgi:hypothetical protein